MGHRTKYYSEKEVRKKVWCWDDFTEFLGCKEDVKLVTDNGTMYSKKFVEQEYLNR